MKEIKISGKVMGVSEDGHRKIYCDSGGIIYISDFIVHRCGEYDKEDRITITLSPCSEDEHHYPPKPNR